MVHSDGLLYDISTSRENCTSNYLMYLNGAFWRYLIRYFGLQRKLWKQRS